jgi:arsenite oxidase small subunit
MTSCPKMVDSGRRKFLSGAGLAAAGMAAATVVPSPVLVGKSNSNILVL